MGVPDPGRERVELRLVQMEPQLDGPGLDQVAVRVVVPLEDVAVMIAMLRFMLCAKRLPSLRGLTACQAYVSRPGGGACQAVPGDSNH